MTGRSDPAPPPGQVDRYSRQILFQPLGKAGQKRLAASTVVVVGCGATGSVIADLMARAGVGRLRLVDRDFVELSNLQRQSLYDEQDALETVPKAVAAERRLRAVNSAAQVEGVVADFTRASAVPLLEGADLAMDGTDNFEARYLLNDLCVRDSLPWVYTGAVGSYGMVMGIVPGSSACFRCAFPKPAAGPVATCDTAGVIGPAVTAAAALSAATGFRLLMGHPEAAGRLTHLDVWEGEQESVEVHRRGDCPCCGLREFTYLEPAAGQHVEALCGRDAVQISPQEPRVVALEEHAERLRQVGAVRVTRFLLRAEVDGHVLTLFPDGRAIIQGTTDPKVARSIYARYVGL